jgi:hypothetical protein
MLMYYYTSKKVKRYDALRKVQLLKCQRVGRITGLLLNLGGQLYKAIETSNCRLSTTCFDRCAGMGPDIDPIIQLKRNAAVHRAYLLFSVHMYGVGTILKE